MIAMHPRYRIIQKKLIVLLDITIYLLLLSFIISFSLMKFVTELLFIVSKAGVFLFLFIKKIEKR